MSACLEPRPGPPPHKRLGPPSSVRSRMLRIYAAQMQRISVSLSEEAHEALRQRAFYERKRPAVLAAELLTRDLLGRAEVGGLSGHDAPVVADTTAPSEGRAGRSTAPGESEAHGARPVVPVPRETPSAQGPEVRQGKRSYQPDPRK